MNYLQSRSQSQSEEDKSLFKKYEWNKMSHKGIEQNLAFASMEEFPKC